MEENSLDLEIELIESSLLPAERLARNGDSFEITSDDSKLVVHFEATSEYPAKEALVLEIKGSEIGREEAEGWRHWVDERVAEWDNTEEYPLYQILTAHFLPLLAPNPVSAPSSPKHVTQGPKNDDLTPHHVLLTSHHLIAPSKRKDLLSLSSQLSLLGFAKVGYPGMIYAIGTKSDLTDWVREVKSWQWLALRVRIAPEPVEEVDLGGKGKESGARGGKGRGEWVEFEKIGEAVEWMRKRGRDRLLTDLGYGVGSEK